MNAQFISKFNFKIYLKVMSSAWIFVSVNTSRLFPIGYEIQIQNQQYIYIYIYHYFTVYQLIIILFTDKIMYSSVHYPNNLLQFKYGMKCCA
jgi:hypothetical protein